jgi:DNA-directed RNA polymerase sigma subunit (sigma70/sigma32)
VSDRRDSRPAPTPGAPPRARTEAPGEEDRVKELAGPLSRVLKRLPKIERDVVEMRMGMTDGHPRNLADTARALNLTPHEAKEIEQRAFERIREVVPLRELEGFLQS